MRKINNKQEKGVTIIALVITIVILAILAAISLSAVIGEDGIIFQAKDTKNMIENETEYDSEQIASMQNELANNNIYSGIDLVSGTDLGGSSEGGESGTGNTGGNSGTGNMGGNSGTGNTGGPYLVDMVTRGDRVKYDLGKWTINSFSLPTAGNVNGISTSYGKMTYCRTYNVDDQFGLVLNKVGYGKEGYVEIITNGYVLSFKQTSRLPDYWKLKEFLNANYVNSYASSAGHLELKDVDEVVYYSGSTGIYYLFWPGMDQSNYTYHVFGCTSEGLIVSTGHSLPQAYTSNSNTVYITAKIILKPGLTGEYNVDRWVIDD